MEIKLLTTFISENHSNVGEPRRAEQEYGARKARSQSGDAYVRPGISPGYTGPLHKSENLDPRSITLLVRAIDR